MPRLSKPALAASLLLAAQTPAILRAAPAAPAARPDAVASFSIGGIAFQMSIPAGYCLPHGEAVGAAQLLASGDKENLTALTLVSCKGNPFDVYILIKAPLKALTVDLSREETLEAVGAAFDTPALREKIENGQLTQTSGKELTAALGQRVDLAGVVKPIGKDRACAYIGGILDVKTLQLSYRVSLGSCISAVGKRFMVVHTYGPDRGSAGVAAQLVKARRLMETIRPLPAA